MKLALVHDMAECIVGDITPYCGVSKEEKHAKERVSLEEPYTFLSVTTSRLNVCACVCMNIQTNSKHFRSKYLKQRVFTKVDSKKASIKTVNSV